MRLRTKQQSFTIEIQIGEETCRLEVNPLSTQEIREIIQRHAKTRFQRNQKIDEYDDQAIRLERFDKTVANWDSIHDVEGQPLECNSENKRLIAEFNHDFVQLVFEETDAINERLNQGKLDLKKKWNAGSNGKQAQEK